MSHIILAHFGKTNMHKDENISHSVFQMQAHIFQQKEMTNYHHDTSCNCLRQFSCIFSTREVRLSHMSEDRTQRAIFLSSVSYPRKSAQHRAHFQSWICSNLPMQHPLCIPSLRHLVALDVASCSSRRATTESKQLTKSGVVACVHK